MSTDNNGPVYLVGAGPGDPDLLTVKARRLLEHADVVMHDSLIGDGILDTIPPSSERINVGKRPDDGRRWKQEEINQHLVEKAREGNTVVRLKGGDSTVFGRGGEEAEHLCDAGIPFEFVPGITSAIAAPMLAGIPATHREHASSLTIITGHEDPTKAESSLDWVALGRTISEGGTLVILMGISRLPENIEALCRNGVSGDTPLAFIERVTWPDGDVTTATLDTAVQKRDEEDIEAPATVVVGDVVEVRDDIQSFLRSSVDLPESTMTGTTVRSADPDDELNVEVLDQPDP
jgi:uroporphyrin-III C-methyltransferase